MVGEALRVVAMVATADFMCGYTAVNNSGLILYFTSLQFFKKDTNYLLSYIFV